MDTIKFSMKHANIFHLDRGGEYKNEIIDKALKDNDVIRSLAKPGRLVDNAVSESAFKHIYILGIKIEIMKMS